jgi:hypothetical protein
LYAKHHKTMLLASSLIILHLAQTGVHVGRFETFMRGQTLSKSNLTFFSLHFF